MEFDHDARREYQVESDIDEETQYERLAKELGYESAEEMYEAEEISRSDEYDYKSGLLEEGYDKDKS